MESIQFEYLNLIAAYMLHALAESQSMGKLMYAFKNVRNMEKFLEENAHAPDGTQLILTRETMAYAISLFVNCVCLYANDDIFKGRTSAAYERALSDLETCLMPRGTHSSRTSSSSTSGSSPTLKVLHRQPRR